MSSELTIVANKEANKEAKMDEVDAQMPSGVYTMHIDSRNLSPDSLLGKALDQIDTDNDGEIEQHELDAFIKHTVRDQVAVKNLKRSLVAMTMLLVAMLVVVFAMGFAAIQASKESHVYNDGETNTLEGGMVKTEEPSAAFNLVDLPILDDDLLADMVNLENVEYGGDTYTYKIAGYVRHGAGETNVTVYTRNNEKLLFSNEGNITVVDSAGVTHVVDHDADDSVRRRLEALGLDINSHDSEHWKTLSIHAAVEEGRAPRSLLTRRLDETGNMHGRSLKYKSKSKSKSYKYKSYKYKTKSKFKVKKSFKSYKKSYKFIKKFTKSDYDSDDYYGYENSYVDTSGGRCPRNYPFISQQQGSNPTICYESAALAAGAGSGGCDAWCCIDSSCTASTCEVQRCDGGGSTSPSSYGASNYAYCNSNPESCADDDESSGSAGATAGGIIGALAFVFACGIFYLKYID